jgi:hypothetical protein
MEQIQILQVERIKTPSPEVNLWLAVIDQAIEDLSDPDLREAALNGSPRPRTGRRVFAGSAIILI